MAEVEKRIGRQTPPVSFILPYEKSLGQEAIDLYNSTSRTARQWQEVLLYDILAVDSEGLWVHSKFGYAIPRRNGKSEILAQRSLFGLKRGERILHTAHRTTTSHRSWELLCTLLDEAGIAYKSTKQFGLETITCENGGLVYYRTRSSKGGLGEGFDTLIVDEAQEYTIDQETALKYVVTDSENPQTIMCGTPPTTVSAGTVFTDLRKTTLAGNGYLTGWAEWSVPHMSDPNAVDLWYEANPSLGLGLTERNIKSEITDDKVDFNIQRLGLWLSYSQKSAISKAEWLDLKVDGTPKFTNPLFIGVKYAYDGSDVSVSVATRLNEDKIFVETYDCCPQRSGNGWICDLLSHHPNTTVLVDGKSQFYVLQEDLKRLNIKARVELVDVNKFIFANALFEKAVESKSICHNNQPSLTQVVSNSEKRSIGNAGGFGYRPLMEGFSPSMLDSVILAFYQCSQGKQRRKQRVFY